MPKSQQIRQAPSFEVVSQLRDMLAAPVLQSRHLRSSKEIAKPLRLNRRVLAQGSEQAG